MTTFDALRQLWN